MRVQVLGRGGMRAHIQLTVSDAGKREYAKRVKGKEMGVTVWVTDWRNVATSGTKNGDGHGMP